jgi:carbon monoxide dehydrogenase subunit G
MIHFEGDKDFALPPGELWARLSDCRFLAHCVPGMVSMKDAELEQAVCVLKPGFSFVRSTLEITLKRLEAVPETGLRYQVHSKGIGSTSQVIAAMTLSPQGTGTHVHWAADIEELGGLLKAIPQGLIQASAERVILDTWSSVEAKLGVG